MTDTSGVDSQVQSDADAAAAAAAAPAPEAPPEVAPDPVVAEEPPVVEEDPPAAESQTDPDAPKTAVVVVGSGSIPKGYNIAIVTEAVAKDETGAPLGKNINFAAGADAYLRYDDTLKFPPKGGDVFTMGDNLKQHNFAGFTRVSGFVNVGPAHPAFGAANLAFQMGATTIDIVGLTADEKERLRVWFDELPTDAVEPAQVTVNLV